MNPAYFDVFEALYQGTSLTQGQAYAIFNDVMRGDIDSTELTALLIALKLKGETSEEIAGAAAAMRNNAVEFSRPEYAFSDLVGTGGDGHNTINISSAASVVAASCGIKVAKHGNRSVSSKSGSSDLFSGFGLKLDMSPAIARKCLDEAGLCFLAAPVYHTGVKYAMPVRLALKTRTLFNVLGPLANPANPTHGIYGVYDPKLVPIYAQTLLALGHNNALVVHGSGLDEIALHGPTQVVHVHNGKLSEFTISPSDFGISEMPLSAIKGDTPQFNVNAIRKVFNGEGETAHSNAIAINAASLLWLNNTLQSFETHYDTVMQSIVLKQPMHTISHAARISQGGL
ncbi:MAG: anthranilate phosphoribosyltransferase [Alphaproteobacteria bacterium]|jgi:anthranilate phosphoribosyltransferase